MTASVRLLAAGLALALPVVGSGCGGGEQDGVGRTEPPPAAAPASPPDTGVPDSPVQEPAEQGSAAAAAEVIAEYYDRVAAGEYDRAYRLWSDSGRASGQSLDEFRSGYAETASVVAEVGAPGRIEGAAGSRYIEVPVAVRALTTAGEAQCFRGNYVLRRAVVDGATEEQRQWRISAAHLTERSLAECAGVGPPETAEDSAAVVVKRLGQSLAAVSLLAPEDVLRRELRERYGPLVTTELLDAWLEDPTSAPGRTVSSPWPDRIEVHAVEATGPSEYRVVGEVIEVTSVESTGGGAAARYPVRLRVVRAADGTFRVAGYERTG